MKYRKYISLVKIGAIVITTALSLGACASSTGRSPDSVNNNVNEEERAERIMRRHDGREPASMQGDFTWLNEVEDEFGRVAAETSNRAVASQKPEVLVQQKEWNFSYSPKTNSFSVTLQGVSYKMIQTTINDGERFAFAAEGQAENPLTFAVSKGEGRKVASGAGCQAEISFWNKKSKAYVTEQKTVKGAACDKMLSYLKEYVP